MRRTILGVAVVAALALTGCGDAPTNDDRGYTKAPLEDPDLVIGREEATAMADLGQPDLPNPPREIQQPGAGAAAAEEGAQQVALAPGVTQEQYDQGKQLFSGQGGCIACHGPDAGGSALAPNLTDAQWLHVSGPNVEELARVIKNGVPQPVEHPSPMPPMGGATLTDEQVHALAGYVASLSQR